MSSSEGGMSAAGAGPSPGTGSALRGSRWGSGSKIVIFYAAIAAIAYVLQLIPVTGIFLMIVGGPIIVGLLMHLMMLHLGAAAAGGYIARPIARPWLIAPVIYYGGGLVLHLLSVSQANNVAEAIAKANASQAAAVAAPFSYLANGIEGLELLKRFKVAAAYIRGGNRNSPEYSMYYYARGDECESASPGFYYDRRFTSPFQWDRDLFPGHKGADKARQCILMKSVETADPDYAVEHEYDRQSARAALFRQYTETWTARDLRSRQIVARVQTGTLVPLPMVQTILAGCGLNSGNPSWDCAAALKPGSSRITAGYKPPPTGANRFIPSDDPETSIAAALAHALGLAARSPTD